MHCPHRMSKPSPQFLCSATRWRIARDPPTLPQASDYLSLNPSTALSQKARNWNSAGSKWSAWRWRERNQNHLKKAILRKSPKNQALMASEQREQTVFFKDFCTGVAMQLVRSVDAPACVAHTCCAITIGRSELQHLSSCPKGPFGFEHIQDMGVKRTWT